MITSNINEILLKNQLNTQDNSSINDKAFVDSLIDTKLDEQTSKTTDFTYENIKGISLEEIETLFTNDDDKQMAKNLRLATMFTDDNYLGQALFNTVMGQPFSLGYSYLSDTYNDKHSYLQSLNNNNNSLSDLLHDFISNKKTNTNDVIPQEYLDEILVEVNSFNFLSALSSTSKDQYGRYKDEEDNDYSFLYNDYYSKYQELLYKYDDLKSYDKNLINQF